MLRKIVVQKYGGTSVGSIERIQRVAQRAREAQRKGVSVVVVVSAMSGETNRLLALGHQLNGQPDQRELDVLAATGEQCSAALTAMAIRAAGGKARSFLGFQLPILTDSNFVDEIYEKLVFDVKFASFAALSKDAFERTVTINGFSKSFAMTGWRLGYAAGPKPVIDAMNVLQGQTTSAPNSIVQKAALGALEMKNDEFVPVVEMLRTRRDRMMAILGESPRLSFRKPDGAFYLFVNASSALGRRTPGGTKIETSDQLALYLLEEGHVGVVPGSGFGQEGYLRISFAVGESDLETACRQIVEALGKLS